MDFSSDNAYGAMPEILDAMRDANAGAVPSYGDDPLTEELRADMARLFEREVAIFPVTTGTAANALALATLCPPHGAIFCHADAHIVEAECGAPEFFTHGARLVPLDGKDGKLMPDRLEQSLANFHKGFVHHPQPAVISLTQASECGTVYKTGEIAEITTLAKRHGMKVHVDGARFANALVHLGCTPAEATWKAGVDVLSFGATKNGALCAEAVVFFDPSEARDFEYRRKKSGHLLCKMRFVSAQLTNYLRNRRWLENAARANAHARRLARELMAISGAEIIHPVEANAVFVLLPDETVARLRNADAHFHDWAPSEKGRTLIRLVLSFATPDADIERFIAIAHNS